MQNTVAQVALASGDIDIGFANAGRFQSQSLAVGGSTLTALALQPDGKIVLAGVCADAASHLDVCLVRLTASGVLDVTFDGPGPGGVGVGTGRGQFSVPYAYRNNSPVAVTVQRDGKFVLLATCLSSSNQQEMCLARLNADGSFDASFVGSDAGVGGNGAGWFYLPFPSAANNEPQNITLLPDGRILILGSCVVTGSTPPARNFCAARLRADGTLDASFIGPDSANTTPGKFLFTVGTGNDRGMSAAMQPDGKTLVAGACYSTITGTDDMCVARLNADGSFDTTFNGDGKRIVNSLLGDDIAQIVLLQPDRKLVLVGQCSNGANQKFCAARFHADGSYDAAFKGPGITSDVGVGQGFFKFSFGNADDLVKSAAMQIDGQLVMYGQCGGNAYGPCVARLNQNGTFDLGFAQYAGDFYNYGRFSVALSAGLSRGERVAVQSDGKLVMAGSCTNISGYDAFCATRINGGPFAARACEGDVDGDGQISATKDGLILSRVLSGVTGNAVTQGVTFAAHARRTSWPRIRAYFIEQCGMQGLL